MAYIVPCILGIKVIFLLGKHIGRSVITHGGRFTFFEYSSDCSFDLSCSCGVLRIFDSFTQQLNRLIYMPVNSHFWGLFFEHSCGVLSPFLKCSLNIPVLFYAFFVLLHSNLTDLFICLLIRIFGDCSWNIPVLFYAFFVLLHNNLTD